MTGRWMLGAVLLAGAAAQQVELEAEQVVQLPTLAPELAVARWLREPAAATPAPKLRLLAPLVQTVELDDVAEVLGDLQQRFATVGLQVVGLFGQAPGDGYQVPKGLAFALGVDDAGKTFTGLGVAGLAAGAAPPMFLCDGKRVVWVGQPGHGLVDAIDLAARGKIDATAEFALANWRRMLEADFEYAAQAGDEAAAALRDHPHDGFARAVAVLAQYWHRGDPAAARAAADTGLEALASEPAPLVLFADLVLRADRHDQDLAAAVATALAPVAARMPASAPTQLVYLRALLRAGRDREAGRLAPKLPKLLGARGRLQLVFAETLAEAAQPAIWRDAAEQALQRAAGAGADPWWVFAARHKVALRCAGDAKAAEAILAAYRASPAFKNSLNNDAWYTLTRLETMGRFDPLALAQCEEMQHQGDLDFGSRDTMALALFCNGRIDDACQMQAGAAAAAGNRKEYVNRLQRYERTRDRLAGGRGGGAAPGPRKER